MKFKLPKSMKNYKTERDYLKSVFYRNREAIVEAFGKEKPMEKFIKSVQARKTIYKFSTKQALKNLQNTQAFTPVSDRFRDIVMGDLKKFGKLKEFKNLIKDDRGKFQKFDRSKLFYEGSGYYTYDNKIFISFKNSPEEIIVGRI